MDKWILHFSLLLVLLGFVFFGSKKGEVTALLRVAEKSIEKEPGKTLILLDSIQQVEKLSEQQQALWCLLYTSVLDRKQIKHTSDSLIQIAVSYYEKNDLPERKMQAYYYYGIVLQDLNDAIQAQDYYLRAYKLGIELERYVFLGRICANLGTLYTYQELCSQASHFQQKAVSYFEKNRDTVRLSLVFRDMARIHLNEHRLDSAVVNYTKALKYTSDVHKFCMFNELTGAYARMGDYEKGVSCAHMAYDRAETVEDSCLVSLALGSLYLRMGKKDSAYHYLSFCRQSTDPYTLKDLYLYLAQFEKSRHNWPTYAFYQEQYNVFRDSIDNLTKMETLARLQRLYDYREIEKKKEYYRQESDRKTGKLYKLSLGGVGCLLFVVCIIFYLWKERKKKEEQLNQSLRRKEQQYLNSQQYLEERNAVMAQLEQQYEAVMAQLSEQSSRFTTSVQEKINSSHPFFTSELYWGVYAEWKKLDEVQWAEVIKMIDHILYKDFTGKIRMLYPRISELDLNVCYLVKLEIPVGRIAVLLSVNSQAISNKRKRLYEKLTQEKGSAQDFDKFIKTF
jgi:tetratricopeptide (TPR) repeat protein